MNSHRGKSFFFSFPERPDLFWPQRVYVYTGYRAVSPGIKRQGHYADHSAVSNDEVKKLKNAGGLPPLTAMPS